MDRQISLNDLLKPKRVIIKGICDDGYCPNCDNCVDFPEQNIDAEQCPHCNTYLDWSDWHIANDDWYKMEDNKNDN